MSNDTQAIVPVSALKLPKIASKSHADIEKAATDASTALQLLSSEDGKLSPAIREKLANVLNVISPTKRGVDVEGEASAVVIPEIVINQPVTRLEGRPENVKNGDLLSVVSRKVVLGILPRPFKFRVLATWRENVMFVDGQSRPECSSPDAHFGTKYGECAKCQHIPLGHPDNRNPAAEVTDCSFNICFLLADATFEQLYQIRFSKTSAKVGRQLHTLIMASRGNIWDTVYSLDTAMEKRTQGMFAVYKIAGEGKADITLNSDEDKAFCAVSDVYMTSRDRFLKRFYDGMSTSKASAEKAEASFSMASLDGEVGTEAEGIGEEPVQTAPIPNKAARSSKTPM